MMRVHKAETETETAFGMARGREGEEGGGGGTVDIVSTHILLASNRFYKGAPMALVHNDVSHRPRPFCFHHTEV
jgi:hypothetical protein